MNAMLTLSRIEAIVSTPFRVLTTIACLFCKEVTDRMNDKIEIYLENVELASGNKFHQARTWTFKLKRGLNRT